MNVTSIKAKLIAICISLISAMERDDIYNVTIVTDSIAAANKILELHVNPFQNIALSLASNIKSFLDRDRRNSIYFWYCPSKAKWSRHKLINDQVKMANGIPILFNKNSFLFHMGIWKTSLERIFDGIHQWGCVQWSYRWIKHIGNW